jgi:NADH-quinone oxidoreductase subunit L
LLVRANVFLDLVPEARLVIAIIGGLTALVGGFTALGQWDIKRVLAYSTVSQLGFMIAAVGIGAYVAAIFHLATHAVFKALLFLGSGSVIHGVEHGHHHVHEHGHGHDDHGDDDHHEDAFDPQDMRNMGGLAGRMPATFVTYLIGTFALSGLPIFAGFWSKDEILADAWHEAFFGHTLIDNLGGFLVLGMLLVAAGFTAFYMWRQIQMVFFGEPRSEAAEHAPESTLWMTVPLVILAIGATFVGLINVPKGAWPFTIFYEDYAFKHFLEGVIPSVTTGESLYFNWLLAGIATGVAAVAIFLAHSIYAGNKAVVNRDEHNLGEDPLFVNRGTRQAWSFSNARMRWDDFYGAVIEQPFNRAGDFLANVIDWNFLHDYFHDRVIKRGFDAIGNFLKEPIDLGLIDGIVNGVGRVVAFFSDRFRGIQTGYVRTYALTLLLGVVVVVLLMLVPLIQLALNGS